jgi:excisionase family DNA binding protein
VQESCDSLGICKPTFYKLLRNGEIQSFFVGKRRLIPYESLIQFCRERVAAG